MSWTIKQVEDKDAFSSQNCKQNKPNQPQAPKKKKRHLCSSWLPNKKQLARE